MEDQQGNVRMIDAPAEELGEETGSAGAEGVVMIGKYNYLTINQVGPSSESGHPHEEECLGILKDILVSHGESRETPRKLPMKLQSLETCFKQRKGMPFKEVMGISMLDFLRRTNSSLRLTNKNNQWFVDLEYEKQGIADVKLKGKIPKTGSNEPLQDKKTSPQYEGTIPKCRTFRSQKSSSERPRREIKDHPFEPNKCSAFDDFLANVSNFLESESEYVLMIPKLYQTKHENALANIPWICVFDFDPESHSNGLFDRVEDTFRKHRNLMTCTWRDQPNITSCGTEWCFVLGSTHDPESKTPHQQCKKWYLKVQDQLTGHIKSLAEHLDTVLPLTVVLFWPEDKVTGFQFEKVLSNINFHIRPLPNVVIVGSPPSEHRILIDQIDPDYFLQEKFEHVLHDLSTNIGRVQSGKQLQYTLPTDDGTFVTDISESQAASFKENLHVLYCDSPYRTDWVDLNKPEEEERLFFKGGTLSWQAYYDYGPDHFYEARDLLVDILSTIKRDFLEKIQSGTIKLYHAPGAGGTTLGQNILWDLHKCTPCMQIRSDTSSSIQDIADNIATLYRTTNLPVVVMLDGPDEKVFDQLRWHLKTIVVVFLLLKRVIDHMDESHFHSNQFLLHGTLSPKEAKRICPKFRRFCDSNAKRDQIQHLLDEVIEGKKHHLIEFGLVTYLEEYTGVAAYVAEYLRLNKKSKRLENFQKVLGYLALVQVFGQVAMPIQVFSKMLGTPPDKKISLGQFPQSVQEFVVMEDKRRQSIRICHFLIAKEILEQVLSMNQSSTKGQDLSDVAKRQLQPFVLQFILDLKSRQNDIGLVSKAVFEIIFQTFIHRDRQMMNESDNPLHSHTSRLSRLLESIPSEQPFTERLEVLESIAHSFPDNPSFWAHLGRAYALFRLREEEKIEEFFEKAFRLCQCDSNQESQFTSASVSEYEKNDHVLSYIHHMYGMFYLGKIKMRIQKCKPIQHEMLFQEEIRKMTVEAETGCRAFEESSKHSFAGYQESFGRMGEIDVRLKICRFLKGHYMFTTIQQLLDKSQNELIYSFVKESLPKIQQLFVQCHNVVDSDSVDAQFYAQVQRYNEIFKGMMPTSHIDHIKVPDTIATRREVVAAVKIKYGKSDHLGTVDDITDESDVNRVVLLLERNLEEDGRGTGGEVLSVVSLDFDYLDWIYVIRHPKQRKLYPVEKVLRQVRQWYKLLHSPYSSFYLFILLCVYGINENAISYIEEALALKSKDFQNINTKIKHSKSPREWLGEKQGIGCLQPGKNFRRMEALDIIDSETPVENLQLLKGTIKTPNVLRRTGYILLDIEGNTDVPVIVFFHPSRTEEQLYGYCNAGVRVEFVLAFTLQNGLQAYNVRKLTKVTCFNCDGKTEIFSRERARKCRNCGTLVENPTSS
ncbi:sterile alpha motif domain-containing protein 9-like [Pecten maximus]|uniref:sterile alpha motif domain-containing protein 9-like n=1 Tax=Pecten maximus TaxID=6579 RepID=UPI001457EA0B|nr:sterile alpha motif domain-containing protein 9-like [Pecten maximus]